MPWEKQTRVYKNLMRYFKIQKTVFYFHKIIYFLYLKEAIKKITLNLQQKLFNKSIFFQKIFSVKIPAFYLPSSLPLLQKVPNLKLVCFFTFKKITHWRKLIQTDMFALSLTVIIVLNTKKPMLIGLYLHIRVFITKHNIN